MAKPWRDRIEWALQTAAEQTTTLRALASEGLRQGERQLAHWQAQRQQQRALQALGEAVWRLARAGRLQDVVRDEQVRSVLQALAMERSVPGGVGGATEPWDDDEYDDVAAVDVVDSERAAYWEAEGFADAPGTDGGWDDDGTVGALGPSGRTSRRNS